MENLPAFGTAIAEVVQPTFKTYAPLLIANSAAIKSTRSETFTYGPHERQALDVYYPSSTETKEAPVFVFIYGGGLVRGDKILPMMPQGLAYANMGHFIAETLGCVAVIPDYRLISHGAKFPSGGEDVDLVVRWIKEKYGGRELFMMGNSAGGVHLSTWLYGQAFRDSVLSVTSKDSSTKLRGVVMLSVPFHFRAALSDRTEVLKTYYGDEIGDHCPLGLFEAAARQNRDSKGSAPFVKTLVLNGTLDPEDEILQPKEDFVRAVKTLLPADQSNLFDVEMMEGQNHISPALSLGTGKKNEEAWGYQVSDWMESIAH